MYRADGEGPSSRPRTILGSESSQILMGEAETL